MIDPAGKKAARQTMGEAVAERDIERLLRTASSPGAKTGPKSRVAKPTQNDFAKRLDLQRGVRAAALVDADFTTADLDDPDALPPHPYAVYAAERPQPMTIWDLPVLLLYACLGIFTRIWTDVTLYFDFGDAGGFRMFAIAVSIALHLLIFAIIGNAWRAKWDIRSRNLLALSVLVGYLGFRTLTQL
ncbi:MAG: hypothetical protein KDK28_07665 [Maritimibacter sp.]|nr:hypothetical protein [Maritimibacter sp.]